MSTQQGETGPLLGSIIVFIIILAGGWYVLTHRPERIVPTAEEIVTTPDPVLEATRSPQSTSTDQTALEEDIRRVPAKDINADLDKLREELM